MIIINKIPKNMEFAQCLSCQINCSDAELYEIWIGKDPAIMTQIRLCPVCLGELSEKIKEKERTKERETYI